MSLVLSVVSTIYSVKAKTRYLYFVFEIREKIVYVYNAEPKINESLVHIYVHVYVLVHVYMYVKEIL